MPAQPTGSGKDPGKTEISARLVRSADEYLISRPQARRLLRGTGPSQRLVFGFTGISEIGQAFADQIFRVFANEHPEIRIETRNADKAVKDAVKIAQNSKAG